MRVLLDVTRFDGGGGPWAKGSGWPLRAGTNGGEGQRRRERERI